MSEPFQPLDDLPLDAAALARWHAGERLMPLAEALAEQLHGRSMDNARGEPPRIGLFGGLGQGKSTVLGQCLELLARRRLAAAGWFGKRWGLRLRDFFLGPPVARFDITHFKTDDLEWRFLTAVLWQRIGRSLLRLWLPLLALEFVLLWALGILTGFWSVAECAAIPELCSRWLWGATLVLMPSLITLAKPVLAAVKSLGKLDPAPGLYIARRDWWMHALAQFTLTLPRVVVVDDLDRARVEQQRAFLRALLRFSRQMGFAVAVCLDESELLDAPPAPEMPEELLRKVIQFELRLPERGREDVVVMALALCRELAELNPTWKARLLAPEWLAAWVRCLLLLCPPSGLSPRRVKHLANDVLLRADQMKLLAVRDCCALLRLECLWQLAPALRRQADAVLRALETQREAELQRALTAAGVSAERQARVLRFFNRSRTMQPASEEGWFRLVGGLPLGVASTILPDESGATESVAELAPRSHEYFRLFMAAADHRGDGYPARLDLWQDIIADPGGESNRQVVDFNIPAGGRVQFAAGDLPAAYKDRSGRPYVVQGWLLWVAALTDADVSGRARMYLAAAAWLDDLDRTQSAVTEIAGLLLRERLADGEVWRSLADTERRHLLGLEPGMPARSFQDIALVDLRREDGAAAMHALAHTPDKRDFRRAAFWLAQIDAPRMTDLDASARASEAVARTWPPPTAVRGELCSASLRGLAEHLLLLDGKYCLPSSVAAAWREYARPWLSTSDCLDILHAAAHPGGDAEWHWERLAAWITEKLPDALSRLRTNGSLDWSGASDLTATQRLTAVALAAQLRWRLPAALAETLDDSPPAALRLLLTALFRQCRGTKENWLDSAEPGFVAALLKRLDVAHDPAWQSAMRDAWGEAATQVFVDLNWPLIGE